MIKNRASIFITSHISILEESVVFFRFSEANQKRERSHGGYGLNSVEDSLTANKNSFVCAKVKAIKR